MKCIDASFIIRLIISPSLDSLYRIYWQQWKDSNLEIVAPTLLMYEVSNALYRYQKTGEMTQNETEELLNQAFGLEIKFYGDSRLHQEAFELANCYHLSATYDAHYLALAQRLQVELWTADKRLFNSVSPYISWVKLI